MCSPSFSVIRGNPGSVHLEVLRPYCTLLPSVANVAVSIPHFLSCVWVFMGDREMEIDLHKATSFLEM